MIAGLVDPTAGEIFLDGRPITTVPAHRRNIGMLFQNYALFPHMTVAENVAFGLEARGIPRAAAAIRVAEALQFVQRGGHEQRMPAQLSGGQQQRVALARALVIEPALLLLDEPLGALDKSLRESMQVELRALQRRLGITTVVVTHDQDEALTMADRIAIMREGRLEQIGSPTEVIGVLGQPSGAVEKRHRDTVWMLILAARPLVTSGRSVRIRSSGWPRADTAAI
jgi:putative spermidine/putrescine transport system ATP-binding protein